MNHRVSENVEDLPQIVYKNGDVQTWILTHNQTHKGNGIFTIGEWFFLNPMEIIRKFPNYRIPHSRVTN